jgi:hypothetical protein
MLSPYMGEKSPTELLKEALRKMVAEGKFASTDEAMEAFVDQALRRAQAGWPAFPEGSLLDIYTEEDTRAELTTVAASSLSSQV